MMNFISPCQPSRALLPLLLCAFAAAPANAHHSFAPYDIMNSIEISGVVESWRFMRPHPMLFLKTQGEQGEEPQTWEIEVATRRWERAEIPQDAIVEGDILNITGWPARNGDAKMVLGAFEKNGVKTVIQTEIRQQSAVEAARAAE